MADRANNWARDLVRTLLLKTNSHFPFRYCNRWPYYLALKTVVGAFRKVPEIRSVYLRHGLTSREWIPGLSDIDITVILRGELAAEREFDLVDSLRARCWRLKRLFPMLGELEILSQDDLEPWLHCTIDAPSGRRWMLLHGLPVLDLESGRSPAWRVRALNFALWVYFDLLPPCVARSDSYLRREDVRRRVRKIIRVLRPILSEEGDLEPQIDPEAGVALLVALAAKALEAAVARVERGLSADAVDASWFPTHANRCHFHSTPPANLAGTRSALVFHDKVVVIVENNSAPEEIAAATDAAANEWPLPPVPLPENVFRYLVCRYNPYDYSALFRGRDVAFGADPLAGMPPPGRAEFAAHLLARLDHILIFTRGEELFPASEVLSFPELESEVRRLMGMRLLLKKGWITPHRYETDAQWRREFPECAQALDQIKLAAAGSDARAARQAAFVLFRSLAGEVRDAVMAPQL